MATLAEMQARVERVAARGLAEVDRADQNHLDEARRALARLAVRVADEGWQATTRQALERLVYDATVSAAQAMARMGREHAAAELREVSERAGDIASRAYLVPAPAVEIERLARDLVARLSPSLTDTTDPAGVLLSESSQLDRIVQTESFRAYTAARRSVELAVLAARPNDVAVYAPSVPARREAKDWTPVIAISWDAALDRRTCPKCASLDRKVRLLGMAFEGYPDPPLHPRCRCVVRFWPFALPT